MFDLPYYQNEVNTEITIKRIEYKYTTKEIYKIMYPNKRFIVIACILDKEGVLKSAKKCYDCNC